MRLLVQRTRLLIDAMGPVFVVPALIVNVLIPLLLFFTYSTRGPGEDLRVALYRWSQLVVPLLGALCPMLGLHLFVVTDSYELFFGVRRRGYMPLLFVLWLVYMADVGLLFVLYGLLVEAYPLLALKVLALSLCYLGLSLFCMQLSHSFTATSMVLVLYTLSNYVFAADDATFPLYSDLTPVTLRELTREGLGFALLGGLAALGAWLAGRRFRSAS